MAIAPHIKEALYSKASGVIRKMFEEGIALKKKFGEDKVYDFSLGNPDLEPPKEVKERILEVAKMDLKGMHGYMPNAGYQSTRQAMADKVSLEQGIKLDFSNVVMSVGAASALNCIFKAILSPGDEVIVPAPFFAEYTNYVKNYNGSLIPVLSDKKDFSLNLEGIKKALSNKTAAVLFNSPNNPTGTVYTESELKELTKILKEHGKKTGRYPYLIADEPYRAITYGVKVPAVFPLYENAVVASSFAKNLSLPGERMGYIAVNPECEDSSEFIAAVTYTTRTLGCVNAPAFFQRVVETTWNAPVDYSSYEHRMQLITKACADAGIEFAKPQGAFYLWCKVPVKGKAKGKTETPDFIGDDFEFTDHLKKYNILAAPGTGFGCSGWFRISYCVAEKTIINSAPVFKNAMETW